MEAHFENLLNLLKLQGSRIEAALICTPDGMAVNGFYPDNQEEESLAVAAANFLNAAHEGGSNLDQGEAEVLVMQAKPGRILIRSLPEGYVLLVLATKGSVLSHNLTLIEWGTENLLQA